MLKAWHVLGLALGITKQFMSPYWPSMVLSLISNLAIELSTKRYVAERAYLLSLSSGHKERMAILESTSRSSTLTRD